MVGYKSIISVSCTTFFSKTHHPNMGKDLFQHSFPFPTAHIPFAKRHLRVHQWGQTLENKMVKERYFL
uniref:Uncharacterized protein n=1 Tax=Arundo donax TaxID=35708 RepID=A0A0A9F4R5_ARUDO